MLALAVLGAILAWYGWTIVDNIWGPGDSSDEAYLMFGVPLIAAGICCVVAAALTVRRR